MGIAVDGTISGINTTALISSIVTAAAGPKQALEERIEDYETRTSKITELVSLIDDLKDALEAIEDIGDFRAYSATYDEDNGAIEVEVDGDAVPGTYSIEVTSLAASEQEVSQGYSSATTDGVVGTGSMDVTYAGTTSSVNITADMSLVDVASAIDDIDGVRAYVLDTEPGTASGAGTATRFRLVVVGEDEGSANTISFDTSGLGGGTAPTFTEEVTASDAVLEVNGVTITATSNTVTNAIPGMTLDLTDTTTSPVTVRVAEDPDTTEAQVQAFVDAYNAVSRYVTVNSVYNPDADIRGAFVGESSVQRVLSGLRTTMTSEFDGLGQDYDALSLIGIEFDEDGDLSIDSDRFQELLSEEPEQIAELFTGDDGFITAMLERIDLYIDSTDGTLEVRKDSLESRIEDLEEQVDMQDRRLARLQARLEKQFAGMETLLGGLQASGQFLTAVMSQSSSNKS